MPSQRNLLDKAAGNSPETGRELDKILSGANQAREDAGLNPIKAQDIINGNRGAQKDLANAIGRSNAQRFNKTIAPPQK